MSVGQAFPEYDYIFAIAMLFAFLVGLHYKLQYSGLVADIIGFNRMHGTLVPTM
jgi:hypothetical protein